MNQSYTHNALAKACKTASVASNAAVWHHIAEFLTVQHLALVGLARRTDPGRREAAAGAVRREAHPVGNTGITYNLGVNLHV